MSERSDAVKLRPWLIGIIVSIAGSGIGIIFKAGEVNEKLGALVSMVGDHESRLRALEKRPDSTTSASAATARAH